MKKSTLGAGIFSGFPGSGAGQGFNSATSPVWPSHPAYPGESAPGINYPWLPVVAPAPSKATIMISRLCLGAKCWPLARLTRLHANEIVATLMSKSFPVALAHKAARALYAAGYQEQSRAIDRLNTDEGWPSKIKYVTQPC